MLFRSDVLRALQRTPASAEAFVEELSEASGSDRVFDRGLDRLKHALARETDERDARRLAELGIVCRATQALDSVEAAMECVNAGIAFAVLPEPDINRYADDAVIRFTQEINFERHVGLATRIESPVRNQIEALADLIPSG